MKIAVDTGAYGTTEGGIARYIGALLAQMPRLQPGAHEWCLYGRGSAPAGVAEGDTAVRVRADGLPRHFGRILSLASSLPWWSRADRPDVFWGPAHRLPLWLPARTARVVTIHDLCWRIAPETMRPVTRYLDAALMPRALREADRIIAVSQATADDLRQAYPSAAPRIVVIREGASALPPPRPLLSLQALGITAPYILFVGTLEPRKNLPALLQAYARVLRPGLALPQLVVAGGAGWGTPSLQAHCDGLGLGAHVRILGRVDEQTLASLYAHALCLTMPSLYEGFGLPLVEAMAMGTPVLTSDCSSMPEVAGPAGLLVDPHSIDAIAAGLRRMVEDSGLRHRLAAAAPAQAARFSWADAARATLQTLLDAARERQQR